MAAHSYKRAEILMSPWTVVGYRKHIQTKKKGYFQGSWAKAKHRIDETSPTDIQIWYHAAL